jgi:MFS family permease
MLTWLRGSDTKPPVLLKLRSSKTFIISTVATAIFTDLFVYGIIVPVLPFALVERADINPGKIQTWISIFLAVYGAALLVSAPICGWFADRSSSRYWPLLLGILALAGSTAMLCVGSSIGVLAAGRVLQGMSAAVVWVVGLALVVDTVGPDEVGQAMGYMGVSMSLAMLVAPLLGGVVFAQAGYYAVFAMAFGLMALDVFLRVVLIERKVAAKWARPDAMGGTVKKDGPEEGNRNSVASVEMDAITVEKDATTAHLPGQQNERPPLEHTTSKRSAAEEVVPDRAPAVVKRWVERMPPVIFLLSSRRLLSALWACVMQATLLTAFDSILPLFVKDTFHWSSIGAGLIFLPIVIVSFLGPIVGWLTDKYGPRLFAIAGYTMACPCLILLRLVHKNTMGQKVLLCALLALVGLSLTLVLTPMMAEITYAVEAKVRRHEPGYFGKNGAYAQAYSLFNVAWAAGCMIGPLLAGLVNQTNGWGTATLILGCISIFTAIPVAIWTGGSIFKQRSARREEQRRRDATSST